MSLLGPRAQESCSARTSIANTKYENNSITDNSSVGMSNFARIFASVRHVTPLKKKPRTSHKSENKHDSILQ